jgi:hypothetical protein
VPREEDEETAGAGGGVPVGGVENDKDDAGPREAVEETAGARGGVPVGGVENASATAKAVRELHGRAVPTPPTAAA